MALNGILIGLGAAFVGLLVTYAVLLNSLMAGAPTEATKLAGAPITVEQIKSVRDRLQKQPIDYEALLPPRQERRYVIVGGSGM